MIPEPAQQAWCVCVCSAAKDKHFGSVMDVAQKKEDAITVDVRPRATDSDDSDAPSIRSLRLPRFAEATSVVSPMVPAPNSQLPLPKPHTNWHHPQLQPHDVGFGYMGDSKRLDLGVEMPATPFTPRSPLRSALRTPGAPLRYLDNPFSPRFQENPLSPTYLEEQALEKREGETDKEQAKDLVRRSLRE